MSRLLLASHQLSHLFGLLLDLAGVVWPCESHWTQVRTTASRRVRDSGCRLEVALLYH